MRFQEKIIDVVSRWPGSAHDSNIFTHSNFYRRFLNGDFKNCAILADSAYPPERFICKPLTNPQTRNETQYQDQQIKARNVAERVNGQLKRQFPVLKYGMTFSIKETAQDVVICCAILYNMKKMAKQQTIDFTQAEIHRQLSIEQDFEVAEIQDGGNEYRIQDFILNHIFN